MVNKIKEDILRALENEKVCHVDINVFVQLWPNLEEKHFTKNLLDFARENDLDYVAVLGNQFEPGYIRFWKVYKEEKENGWRNESDRREENESGSGGKPTQDDTTIREQIDDETDTNKP